MAVAYATLHFEMQRAERIRRARLGGLTTASRHDPREYTAAARQAFVARFYAGIPEDLPAPERDRRAEAARKLYYVRMAAERERSRAMRKAATGLETVAAEPMEGTSDARRPAA